MNQETPKPINSISEYHSYLRLKKPTHPLVSVINFDECVQREDDVPYSLMYNFYSINLKKDFDGKVKYGQQYYDFDEGVMTFYAPKQVINLQEMPTKIPKGYSLMIHPDFLLGTPLASKIHNYGFFSYASYEALHLSEREEVMIETMFENLITEISALTDVHTQSIVLSHIELLLSYCDRFYHRQFITRKTANNSLVMRMEDILNRYFESGKFEKSGLPTVQYLASELYVSPSYLGDMLRYHTGMNTQQHIHNKIIERAKELLSTTNQSIAEIAYSIGFEHPQSFTKLFKSKTSVSPVAFRKSFR